MGRTLNLSARSEDEARARARERADADERVTDVERVTRKESRTGLHTYAVTLTRSWNVPRSRPARAYFGGAA